MTVHTAGHQHNDGRLEPYIAIDGAAGVELAPAQAREVAAALLAAADQLNT